mmetsp:Transcript_96455/g.261990  ORF Transcript_96455/g.261990 Transcript_96455/m.261990 type:complete len:210 (-) Transcript_96455:820-1449(-)
MLRLALFPRRFVCPAIVGRLEQRWRLVCRIQQLAGFSTGASTGGCVAVLDRWGEPLFQRPHLPHERDGEEQQKGQGDADHHQHLNQRRRLMRGRHHIHIPLGHELEGPRQLRWDVARGVPEGGEAVHGVDLVSVLPGVLDLQKGAECESRNRDHSDPLQPRRQLRVEPIGQHAHLHKQVCDDHVQRTAGDDHSQGVPNRPHSDDIQRER